MKKYLLLLITLIGPSCIYADDYPYLTFETADGTRTSVSVSSLTLSISDGKLTAGDKTFTLTDLTKMYFSTTDVTSIEKVMETVEGEVEVFNLRGVSMGKYENIRSAASALKTGIYVIKSKSETIKVSVK